MQPTDVLVRSGSRDGQLRALAFQDHARALRLSAADGDLVGRRIRVEPGDRYARRHRDLLGSEQEVRDADDPGPRLRSRGLTRHGAFQAGKRNDEILLGVRFVALETAGQVSLVVDLLVGKERLILPLAVTDVVFVFGAPAGTLFHHRVGYQFAFL